MSRRARTRAGRKNPMFAGSGWYGGGRPRGSVKRRESGPADEAGYLDELGHQGYR